MQNIDLHIHSGNSGDGEFTTSELLRLCKEAQIKYLSITDHNTVSAVSEVLSLAPKHGAQFSLVGLSFRPHTACL